MEDWSGAEKRTQCPFAPFPAPRPPRPLFGQNELTRNSPADNVSSPCSLMGIGATAVTMTARSSALGCYQRDVVCLLVRAELPNLIRDGRHQFLGAKLAMLAEGIQEARFAWRLFEKSPGSGADEFPIFPASCQGRRYALHLQ